VIYLDSCALVKLIRDEDGSAELEAWLAGRPDEVAVTSEIARTEMRRVIRRNNHTDQSVLVDALALDQELAEADSLLADVGIIALDSAMLARAGDLADPMIRTLDAVHLVSAQEIGPAGSVFVTFDRRLRAAAEALGFTTATPM
jgi:uncharacterized protein